MNASNAHYGRKGSPTYILICSYSIKDATNMCFLEKPANSTTTEIEVHEFLKVYMKIHMPKSQIDRKTHISIQSWLYKLWT